MPPAQLPLLIISTTSVVASDTFMILYINVSLVPQMTDLREEQQRENNIVDSEVESC